MTDKANTIRGARLTTDWNAGTTTPATITMHKGGTGEKEIKISALQVPDLWHVAQHQGERYKALILDCWHLAHAMKDHLQGMEDPEPAPRPPERIEIARKPATRDRNGLIDTDIVLVFLEGNECTPFVTWECGHKSNITFQGHYFESLSDATEDFETR